MQGTTRHWVYQPAWIVLQGLAVLSLLGLALLGQTPGEVAGWGVTPAAESAGLVRLVPLGVRWWYVRWRRPWGAALAALGRYLVASWPPVLLRSLALWGAWEWSGHWGPRWLRLLPWVLWLWQGLAVGWPHWRQRALWRGVQGGCGKPSGCFCSGICWWAGSARGLGTSRRGRSGRAASSVSGTSPGWRSSASQMAATRLRCAGTLR